MTNPAPSVQIRGVDQNVWRQFRSAVVLDGRPLGQVLTEILRNWLAQRPT